MLALETLAMLEPAQRVLDARELARVCVRRMEARAG